jgi:hypothetical protein
LTFGAVKFGQVGATRDQVAVTSVPQFQCAFSPRAAFERCFLFQQEITDELTELLIQIIHRIGAMAERRVERELIGTFKRVAGKNTLLCRLAETLLLNPDGIIREVLFPVVDEQTLADLVIAQSPKPHN